MFHDMDSKDEVLSVINARLYHSNLRRSAVRPTRPKAGPNVNNRPVEDRLLNEVTPGLHEHALRSTAGRR